VLYQIRDDELILDSLFSVCPDAVASAPEAISTDSEVSVGRAAAVSAVYELDSIVPCLEATDRWAQQGAKPKHPPLTSSTPGPWITACRGKHGGKLRPRSHPPHAPQITTSNTFSILDVCTFPPLPVHNTPPESECPSLIPSASAAARSPSAARIDRLSSTPLVRELSDGPRPPLPAAKC